MRYKFTTGDIHLPLIVFILSFICSFTISAQSERNSLVKIEELRLNQDFNPESPIYIDLIIELANELLYSNKDSTLLLANEGLALSLKTGYKKGEGYAYVRLGDYYAQLSDKEKYTHYFDKALEISTKYNYDILKVTVLNNYGTNLSIAGDYDNALLFFLEDIELCKKINDTKLLAPVYDNVAIMYSQLKDYDTAIKFHEKSMGLSEANGNNFVLACTLSNMAYSYANIHNFDAANKSLDKAMSIFTEEKVLDWLSYCYEVKGIIALEKKNYSNALEWYMESNILCEDLNYFTGIISTHNGLADAYVGLGQIDSAEHYALKAYKKAKVSNFPEALMKSSKTLAKISKSKGEFEKATEYQDEYLNLYEESGSKNFKKGLAMFRSEQKYQAQKKQILQEKNKEIATQQIFTYIALFGLVVLIVILILIYRNYKIQRKFNAILQKNQQVLEQSEIELSESNTTKDKLFSLIAHDLRGPVNSFYGIMELYVNGQMTKEESDQFLPVALEDLRSITDMLDNLLVWGKTQINGITHKPKNININTLVQDNIRLLRPLSIKKSITITNKVNKETISYSDDSHINIVLRNLLSNSIKFTNTNGKITISAIEKDGQIQVSIADNGVGMDSETTKNIFNENNYKSTYGTNNEKGTGLGLSICQEMVEKNGGEIWVKSTLNEGTTFYFTLPSKHILKKVI